MEMMNTGSDTMRSLLRGEISAVETYRQAKEKFLTEPGFDEIHNIEEEHEEAVRKLKNLVGVGYDADGEEEGSGAWGLVAKSVVGAAKIGGYKATLKALKEGEEHGLKEYDEALSREDVGSRELLQELRARQSQHINVIDRQLH